eukprot:CAMPEP_0119571026 /NCGR_PEP_ID=MMETSP1352-20130426/43913_1 /TAXON_ID=265584 /ORGANISM="Stauroneis constricta, Strain CCMP1120" /LENGTH=234 /DNA_ID=CAMNT_0007620703 /DNA_START=715 /DNA_END=1416 /DNA_ORIENTATION=-
MMIKVEQDALLRVLSRAPSSQQGSSSYESPIPDEEFVIVDIPKSLEPIAEDRSRLQQHARKPHPNDDDDEPSVCTLSTDSLSTDSESISSSRRVSFAAALVTEEWTRPWTAREDVPLLYYSTEETTRFRQEYRMERKVLSELSIDPQNSDIETDELTGLFTGSPASKAGRHHISRVVVLHNDKIETFFNPEPEQAVAPPPTAASAASIFSAPASSDQNVDFFDNDSFWSGSLTW